jgi:hypothetical protein
LALSKAEKIFLVARSCTRRQGKPEELGSYPLESYRNLPAYILLGDPGAGKTKAFEQEAEAAGGEFIRARDFAIFEPTPEQQNKILFIDGLDEMRAGGGDGKTPLDHIRKHLERLGQPRFRLSCREADWLGESDRTDLNRISRQGEVVALHLDVLSENDVIEILTHKNIADPQAFVRTAEEHKLGELLRNPQTLNLLVEATGGKEWPQSRKEIYEMACAQLERESSREHRLAKRDQPHTPDMMLDAAGYLSAVHLLSGIAGYALDEDAGDTQHCELSKLATQNLPLLAALKTNLFLRDNEEQRIPVHRSVAEFLGARYLAKQIEIHGLPFGRVLALITGEDGGIVPDLRGLAAWLAVHSISSRTALIERDALAVVLYGDVRFFPVAAKQKVLAELKIEAQKYTWFRSGDWSSSPFGALGTQEMESAFKAILSSPSRDEADQALLGCVLDAIRYGEPMSALIEPLAAIICDASYWENIRLDAIQALWSTARNDGRRLVKIADDIQAETVEDSNGKVMDALLCKLYPNFISPIHILDYLQLPEERYEFFRFWDYELHKITPSDDLPSLLDRMVERHGEFMNDSLDHRKYRMSGELLVRGLVAHGDAITNERLYDWLGVGLDKHEHTRLEREHFEGIANWFTTRPDRYKAVIEQGMARCITHENIGYCMNRCMMRLHGLPPADMGMWYLKKATAVPNQVLAEYFFNQAINLLIRDGGQSDLTLPALDFLGTWIETYPFLTPWLKWRISCPIGEWQQESALHDKAWKAERQTAKKESLSYFRKHIVAIRDGSAHPQALHDLALASDGLIYGVEGETSDERLADFLDGDQALIAAAHAGFRNALERNDLPSVSEIVALELKVEMHYIRPACLIGMDEFYTASPSVALQLNDDVLSALLAFRLGYNVGEEPAWFIALVESRPKLVADVLIAYVLPMLRAHKEHINGVGLLAYNATYEGVARLALPALLAGFPLRARTLQLTNLLDPLLKGALRYLDKTVLADIVKNKLKLGSIDAAQRVYWLGCGLLIAPELYIAKLLQYLGDSKVRRDYLAGFLNDRWERGFTFSALPENIAITLIELLAVDCSPQRSTGVFTVTPAMDTAEMLLSFINSLSGNPDEAVTRELERLLAIPGLTHWHLTLRSALHNQRIARRKASFQKLEVAEVSRTLANLQPANAADLAALTFDHLRDIARKIRDGNTDDYEQYWSRDESNKEFGKSKPENDCRNALLSDLQERLGRLGVDAQRESSRADNKRADILISYGGANGFNVPIEAKKDDNPDLWRAIHEQLIPKYVRDPGADGYGIYLVFWFGGKGMKPPSDGKKLRSADALEERLRQTLTLEERHRIQVCVIDCALN